MSKLKIKSGRKSSKLVKKQPTPPSTMQMVDIAAYWGRMINDMYDNLGVIPDSESAKNALAVNQIIDRNYGFAALYARSIVYGLDPNADLSDLKPDLQQSMSNVIVAMLKERADDGQYWFNESFYHVLKWTLEPYVDPAYAIVIITTALEFFTDADMKAAALASDDWAAYLKKYGPVLRELGMA